MRKLEKSETVFVIVFCSVLTFIVAAIIFSEWYWDRQKAVVIYDNNKIMHCLSVGVNTYNGLECVTRSGGRYSNYEDIYILNVNYIYKKGEDSEIYDYYYRGLLKHFTSFSLQNEITKKFKSGIPEITVPINSGAIN